MDVKASRDSIKVLALDDNPVNRIPLAHVSVFTLSQSWPIY